LFFVYTYRVPGENEEMHLIGIRRGGQRKCVASAL